MNTSRKRTPPRTSGRGEITRGRTVRGEREPGGRDPGGRDPGGRSRTVAVLGAGSWGSVLAIYAARRGHRVHLWEFDPERAAELARTRINAPFVPDHPLPPGVSVTADLAAALDQAELALVVVPSHAMASVAGQIGVILGAAGAGEGPVRGMADAGPVGHPLLWISATKGIEEGTGRTPSQVLMHHAGLASQEVAVLLGPSLAAEVADGKPAALLAAADTETVSGRVQETLSGPQLRIYTSSDRIGVEIGVSLKNVIAIAAGIVTGLDLGHNAMGALLTRGLAEISRLGMRMGARRETFLGLGGIGDLVTTCASPLSRNHQVGLALAKGERLPHILDRMVMVAEGVRTTRSALELARSLGIEMPITEQMHAVLFEEKDPRQALADLMNRPPREEFWGEADD